MYNLCSEKITNRGNISLRAGQQLGGDSRPITGNYKNSHVASVTHRCLFYYQHPKYRANHILRACKNLSQMSGAWEPFYAKQVIGTPYLFDRRIQPVLQWKDSSQFWFTNFIIIFHEWMAFIKLWMFISCSFLWHWWRVWFKILQVKIII